MIGSFVWRRLPWLKMAMATSIAALVFQLFPKLRYYCWYRGIWIIDPGNWSPLDWFILTLVAALGLIATHFGPAIVSALKQEFGRRAVDRARLAEREAAEKKRSQTEDQKELFRRMHEARKRQVY